jgi:hypothetical protein
MKMSIKSNAIKAMESKTTYAAAIAALRKDFGRKAKDTVRATLLPIVAAQYSVAVVTGAEKSKSAGKPVLDSDSGKYEAARKMLQELVRDITGGGKASASAKYEFSRKQLSAAKGYLALFANRGEAIAAMKAAA